MTKLLTVNNVVKTFRTGGAPVKVVDHVNLEVYAGDFIVIMGASGSGKTSLLHLLAGIDVADGGSVVFQNSIELGRMRDAERTRFRRGNIGIVFQQQCLIGDLTVYENIMLPVMLAGSREARTGMRDTILSLCRRFGLEEHIGKYPSQLSGGQQQRTAILRAVVNRPPLLLCDEPTGSLNSAQSEMVMDLLVSLNGAGQTIILVTHDVKVAARGKRVVYIADGRVTDEMELSETCPEAMPRREDALARFLQRRGW